MRSSRGPLSRFRVRAPMKRNCGPARPHAPRAGATSERQPDSPRPWRGECRRSLAICALQIFAEAQNPARIFGLSPRTWRSQSYPLASSAGGHSEKRKTVSCTVTALARGTKVGPRWRSRLIFRFGTSKGACWGDLLGEEYCKLYRRHFGSRCKLGFCGHGGLVSVSGEKETIYRLATTTPPAARTYKRLLVVAHAQRKIFQKQIRWSGVSYAPQRPLRAILTYVPTTITTARKTRSHRRHHHHRHQPPPATVSHPSHRARENSPCATTH
jgi:hypothetical protein